MSLHNYPGRLLLATGLSSLTVLGLCGVVAIDLNREQFRTAEALGENVDSRRAASNLEETLTELALYHQNGSADVALLQERAAEHLADIDRFADKERERDLVRRVAASYQAYLRLWQGGPASPGQRPELARYLRERTLPICQELRNFNATQIDESEREHRRSLRHMTWGLALVGGLGSVAGLVLGYGLARSLRRTIHQFLLRVQGASDLLGQELATVEWQREGGTGGDGADELLPRVEQVIFKLQQREREARRAERLAAVGQLAAGVAHEVRNPLTSAILLIQTSRKDPSAGGLTDEDLELIEGELHRVEQTLQIFIDYARPPKMVRCDCDLAAIARDGLSLARARIERQRVEVRLEAEPGACTLEADPGQLRQVVLNLILNALDAMPHGGQLHLAVRPAAGDLVELAVTDTGPGIAPDIFPRLFEPFATGKQTGLGLGLVVCKRIVAEHGGTIRGSNCPGGGACFAVLLPRQAPSPVLPTPTPAAELPCQPSL